MTALSRRGFIRSSAMGVAGVSIGFYGSKATARVMGANDRVRMAVVGAGGRGNVHLRDFSKQPNLEIVYLVEPDQVLLDKKLSQISNICTGEQNPKGVRDYRTVLEDKTIDAVSIATPNHWHTLMTVWGAQAGKHVYVEKPMSHDLAEGMSAVAAQQKYGVVVQHGTQSRSSGSLAGLNEAIKAGKFGRLKIAYGYACKPRNSIGFKPVENPPDTLDWDLWRGPAKINEFHRNLVHYNWHWFWESGNGEMNNQATHQLDIARRALDDDQTFPVKVMALGGRFQWKDQGVTPNTMFAMAEFPNGQQVFMNIRNVNYEGYETQVENEYYFEDGGRIVRNKYYAKGSDTPEPLGVKGGKVTPGGPYGAFLTAVRAHDPALVNGNVVDAHNSSALGHLMNNSYRLGKEVPFNKVTASFGDNKDAHEHFGKLHEIMSKGVGLPVDGNNYMVGPMLQFDPATQQCVGENAQAANKLLKDENRKGFEVPAPSAV